MIIESLTSSYQPIQQYRQMLTQSMIAVVSPQLSITPMDAYILKQITACYPQPLTIIDLAAHPTLGASSIFWLAHSGIDDLYVAENCNDIQSHTNWQDAFHHVLPLMQLDSSRLTLFKKSVLDGWSSIHDKLNSLTSVMVLLAVCDPFRIRSQLEMITNSLPEAIIFIFPLGRVGDSPVVETALRFCGSESEYRLIVVRDASPFWGSSQLGLVHQKDHNAVGDVLKRIQHQFIGNGDFLSLVQFKLDAHLAQQSQKLQRHEQVIAQQMRQAFMNDELPLQPLLSGRLVRTFFNKIIPLSKQPSLTRSNQWVIRSIRNSYHFLIPVKLRLVLRTVRVKLIGM